jgi:hypothetical protein
VFFVLTGSYVCSPFCGCIERRHIMKRYHLQHSDDCLTWLYGCCYPCALYQHYAFLRTVASKRALLEEENTAILRPSSADAVGVYGRPDSGEFQRADRNYVIAEEPTLVARPVVQETKEERPSPKPASPPSPPKPAAVEEKPLKKKRSIFGSRRKNSV